MVVVVAVVVVVVVVVVTVVVVVVVTVVVVAATVVSFKFSVVLCFAVSVDNFEILLIFSSTIWLRSVSAPSTKVISKDVFRRYRVVFPVLTVMPSSSLKLYKIRAPFLIEKPSQP